MKQAIPKHWNDTTQKMKSRKELETMEQEELDYLFQSGKIPAWAYYQLRDKPVWMKAQEQHNRLLEIVREREAAREAQEAEEKLTKD